MSHLVNGYYLFDNSIIHSFNKTGISFNHYKHPKDMNIGFVISLLSKPKCLPNTYMYEVNCDVLG